MAMAVQMPAQCDVFAVPTVRIGLTGCVLLFGPSRYQQGSTSHGVHHGESGGSKDLSQVSPRHCSGGLVRGRTVTPKMTMTTE